MTQHLRDQIEILEKDKENNKNLQECVNYFKDELSNEKDKVAKMELEI